ncbi:sterol desaturase family protein [Leptospira sp. 201903071]|uniref:sterol desaturase family protein n=1 Tax=Leptospira ainazelensis TaxID=2810034 RepID=UPI00196286E9|nr:sterol desaturase family protein [Leptospira ainazelensis]MBM9498677.1 sterol desaturase family protein [Leptospira ainazelensis]
MEHNFVILFIPFLFLFIGLEIVFSWRRNLKLYRFSDSLNNLTAGISNQIFIIVFHSITIAGYLWIYLNWRIFDLPSWPTEILWSISSRNLLGMSPIYWSWGIIVLTWAACLFFYELAYYWNHRLSHEINFLWAGHIVHHQSEEYNLSVAFRQASFRGLFTWVFYLPLSVLGFPPVMMGLVGQFSLIYQFLIHTRWIKKFPYWFERIFNTPSHHRVHHGRNPKYINKNYGGTFIFFDKWFGTFEPEAEEVVYGITTQLKSFNPLWANFHYWWEMIDLAKKTYGWKNRMKVFVAIPGREPTTFVDPGKKPETDLITFKKYDVILPKGVMVYSTFWSFLILTGSYLALANVTEIPTVVLQTIFFISILSFVSIGGICDLRRWVLYLEPIRLLYFDYITFQFFGTSVFSFSIFGFSLLSWVWLLFYRDFFGDRKEKLTF